MAGVAIEDIHSQKEERSYVYFPLSVLDLSENT